MSHPLTGNEHNATSDCKDRSDGIRSERVRSNGRLGDKRIERSHQETTDDTENDAASTHNVVHFASPVGKGIQQDSRAHKYNAAEDEKRASSRLNEVIQDNADDESKSDPQREGDSHTCEIDRRDQEKIS